MVLRTGPHQRRTGLHEDRWQTADVVETACIKAMSLNSLPGGLYFCHGRADQVRTAGQAGVNEHNAGAVRCPG